MLSCCDGVSSSSKITRFAPSSLAVRGDLLGLAGADEGARVGAVEPLGDDRDNVDVGGVREPLELGERLLDRPVVASPVDADEHRDVAVLERSSPVSGYLRCVDSRR